MTKEEYKQASQIFQDMSLKKAELELVEHLLDNAPNKTTRVRVDGRWTIELPVQVLRGGVQQRKTQLEQEIADLESQLLVL